MSFMRFSLGIILMFSLISCNQLGKDGQDNTVNDSESTPVIQSQTERAPVKVNKEIINNINWEINSTFQVGDYKMRGVEDKVGFIDEPFIENQANKYMWHFWGNTIPNGKLTVIAVQKDREGLFPVLVEDGSNVWTTSIPQGSNNGANVHIPSNMRLTKSGKWALLIYLGDQYLDYIVVEVE